MASSDVELPLNRNGDSLLSDQQTSALAHFKDISGINDDDSAKNFLEANSWDLERAVHQFMGYGDPREQSVRRRNHPPPTVDIAPENQHVYHALRPQQPWYTGPMSLVMMPVRFAYSIVCDFVKVLLSFIWPDSRPPLTDPAADVRNFITDFRTKYLPSNNDENDADVVLPQPPLPPFYNGTYGEALREAKQSLRFLVIYLHGDSHEDTDEFCRGTLLNERLLNFLNNTEQVLFWACNINSAEGYRVSQVLREHTYPFIGVVGLSANPAYSNSSFGSSTRMALLGRIEGLTCANDLIAHLTKIMDDHQGVLVAERADRAERELSNRLRREQDEAFAESLAVDRAKAAERAANEEAAAQLAAQAADAERRAARLARARLRRQRYWTRALPPAPTPRNATTPTVRLSTKLPNGQRAQRVFSVKDSVKHLYYFIISQEGAPENFAVESNYPKRIIETRPQDESDLEDYVPLDSEGDNDDDYIPPQKRQIDEWTPNGSTDPPSFEDAGLTNPEMLFILDLDS